MGLKAGLQILQQTGKAVANYTDDATRLVATKGYDAVESFCRKPTVVNPAELKGLRYAPEATCDTVCFSQKVCRTINGNALNLRTIQTDEEFKIILEELLKDFSYKWKSVQNSFDYEKAILPYAGRGDISLDINTFLREGLLKNKTYAALTNENMKKYIQLLEYGLRQLDKEYGQYSGIVYRYGPFSCKTPNYISSSDKILGALNIADKSNPCKETYNIIFTKHGHKINEMQKRLGFKFAETESEILLDPGKSYTELVDNIPQLSKLREKFYHEFGEIYPDINPKKINLKFWKEV